MRSPERSAAAAISWHHFLWKPKVQIKQCEAETQNLNSPYTQRNIGLDVRGCRR